jgi:hypothetical protein
VTAPEGLQAREWYLLDGEIRADKQARYLALRPGLPRLAAADVWLVVRTDTLAWQPGQVEQLIERADRWRANGSRVVGIQLDFDARTRGLGDYASFLAGVRKRLPERYRLSITGLMDWSANGRPEDLRRLDGLIDEVVIQTYQGRHTIPGYQDYFERMRDFPIPLKVGLVDGGEWREPPGLADDANFRGYVVFLLNPKRPG